MFALNIPSTFGDTIDCRINGKPKRVTWRDEHTLVIETDPYATAPVDTDKFGANWTGLGRLASELRGVGRRSQSAASSYAPQFARALDARRQVTEDIHDAAHHHRVVLRYSMQGN